MNLKDAKQFVAHFVAGDYAPEEYAVFLQWLKGATVDELNAIADEHEALHESWDIAGLSPSPEWVMELEAKLDQVVESEEEESEEGRVREIGIARITRRRTWIAAASVVVLLAGGTILYTQRDGIGTEGMRGKRSELAAMSNTMTVPMGGEAKQLILADGSKVLLNAASTLKYPVAFGGPDRMVELSGEAYFEVSPNSGKPFRVLIRDAKVEVLGTNFNVMAYDDEPVSKTTLIEGAVRVEKRGQMVTLKPKEQAEIAYSSTGVAGDIKINHRVDADAVMAWKSGDFRFTNEDLRAVMRVIGRYYNVGIQYDPNVPDKSVTGVISRSLGLQQNLNQLKSIGFHFFIKGQTVKVTL